MGGPSSITMFLQKEKVKTQTNTEEGQCEDTGRLWWCTSKGQRHFWNFCMSNATFLMSFYKMHCLSPPPPGEKVYLCRTKIIIICLDQWAVYLVPWKSKYIIQEHWLLLIPISLEFLFRWRFFTSLFCPLKW